MNSTILQPIISYKKKIILFNFSALDKYINT